MKKNILLLVTAMIFFESMAYGMKNCEFPVHGTSTSWELHVVKNNGMDTHIKSTCANLAECWEKYEYVKHSSNNFQYVKNVWMEKLNKQIHIIK